MMKGIERMKKLKIAIIGCGRIAVVYRDALTKLEQLIDVVIAVDKDISRAKEFASFFKDCRYTDKLDDLLTLKEVDVVHVLSPHFLHKDHVISCLNAGFNVLTEKPIAINLDDAALMGRTALETGMKLGVIFQNRYIKGIREAKKLLDQGLFGKITGAYSSLNWHRPASYYECDWKGTWEKEGGGVVIDQAIHSIDLVRYLMGCEAKSIKANIDTRVLTQIEVEDVADAAITFENGATYSFYACNYYTSNSPIQIKVSAEKGSILLNGDVVTIDLGGNEIVIYPSDDDEGNGQSYWGKCHYDQISDYYQCILQDKPVPFSPEDATKTLEIVLAIYQSSKENIRISL